MILGHANPKITKMIKNAVSKGTSYGAPTPLEVKFAKMIQEAFPSMEMMRMVSSGTEATMSALRLARGYTNRNKILKFDGCYHGHADSLLVRQAPALQQWAYLTASACQRILQNTQSLCHTMTLML